MALYTLSIQIVDCFISHTGSFFSAFSFLLSIVFRFHIHFFLIGMQFVFAIDLYLEIIKQIHTHMHTFSTGLAIVVIVAI